MSETTRTTDITAKRRDDRRFRTASKPWMRFGETTYLVLITVAAALLTGVLALPFTMPGRASADAEPTFGAADAGPPASFRTAARLT